MLTALKCPFLRCLFVFSWFHWHFFLSLTETVDSFAKGILNQRTHVPVVVKHHDNSDDFDNSCTPKSCPLLSLLSSIMPTGWFWPFVSLLNFRKFYLVVNTQDVPRAMYLLPFAFPFSRRPLVQGVPLLLKHYLFELAKLEYFYTFHRWRWDKKEGIFIFLMDEDTFKMRNAK